MTTHRAEYMTTLECVECKMAEHDVETAKRETRLIFAMIATVG